MQEKGGGDLMEFNLRGIRLITALAQVLMQLEIFKVEY